MIVIHGSGNEPAARIAFAIVEAIVCRLASWGAQPFQTLHVRLERTNAATLRDDQSTLLARRNASIAEIQRLHGLLKVERKNLVDAEVAMREADDFIARAARVNKQIGGLQ